MCSKTENSKRKKAPRDLLAYHKSIAAELVALRDRVRNLIGGSHYPTDGGFKEVIVRKTLRNHLPVSLSVGHGFVCLPEGNSSQIDIMVTRKDKPTLFLDGELAIVTADAVEAIIEVKTGQSDLDFKETVAKLCDDIEAIRENGNPFCQVGLFVHEADIPVSKHSGLLDILTGAIGSSSSRIINWIAYGNHTFVRSWGGLDWEYRERLYDALAETQTKFTYTQFYPIVNGGGYSIDFDLLSSHSISSYHLKDLAHAYFVSNVVWSLVQGQSSANKFAWFPIEEGKQAYTTGTREMDFPKDAAGKGSQNE